MENYYGLPQMIWDDLACSAEEYLEGELCSSAHILGLYPYGNRLHGLESESPGLLCIYSDSTIDRLLNPFVKNKCEEPHYTTVRLDGSFVYFIDLWSWLCTLNDKADFMHIVPCFGDIIHQDTSIESIISLSAKLLFSQVRRNCAWVEESYSFFVAYNLRTSLIFAKENIFCPCVKEEWDTVHKLDNLPEDIKEIDNKILAQEELTQKELVDYRNYTHSVIDNVCFMADYCKTKNELIQEAIKYFRFQF